MSLIYSGGSEQTVEQMLYTLPHGVREVRRGQTDFSDNVAACREYDRHLARHPESDGPPGFDLVRQAAFVQGTYAQSSHPWTSYYDFPSGVLQLGGGVELEIRAYEEQRTPAYGQEIWALVSLVEDGGEVTALIRDFDAWTGSLCVPDYGGSLASDLARSRINALLIAVSEPPPIVGASEDQYRELLSGMHNPDSAYLLDNFLPIFNSSWPTLNTAVPDGAEGPTSTSFPSPRLIKTSVQAQEYAADVLRALGYRNVAVTGPGADGGVDIRCDHAVAQVKMEGVVTERPVVQALYGVAALERVVGLLFSLAGYTREAITWADQAGVACFEFAFDGSIEAKSVAAQVLLSRDATDVGTHETGFLPN